MPVSGKQTTGLCVKSSANIASFAERVLKAKKGESGIVEPTFVYLPGVSGGDAIAKETGCDYFSVPVELGVSLISPMELPLLTFLAAQWSREGHQYSRQRQCPREEAHRDRNLWP